MAVYKYVGRTRKGSMKKGTMEGTSKAQVIAALREKGISPREVTETKATLLNRDLNIGGDKVKYEHFVIYCRQFATLIRSGITIVQATNILSAQTESKGLKKALFQVEADIREGHSFSEAAGRHPKVFPPLFVHMFRAGEMAGNIDETLDRLADYFEKQNNLRKKVQSTMAYPLVLMVVIVAVVIFLMVAIVPELTATLEGLGGELPAITKFVIATSELIQQYWWLALILTVVGVGVFSYLFKNNKDVHYYTHLALLKMPIFGKLLQKSALANMTRTLSSLFASSVPVLNALTIAERVVGNPVIGKVVLESRSSLEDGRPLSEPMEASWVFPPLVTHMTAIGEQTGQLDTMFGKIADFYEEDVDRTVDTLKSLIEPVMIILLAGVVGIIVISIMLPMFSVYTEM